MSAPSTNPVQPSTSSAHSTPTPNPVQPTALPVQPPAMPVQPPAPTKPYPARGSKDAPHFGGPHTSLERYLEDIEALCTYRGEDNDLAKIRKALWYVDIKYVDSWKTILDETKSWAENRKVLLEYYPGLDSLYKYSINDMKKLVDLASAKEISKPEHLAEYHCEFMIIASYLEKERLMTRDDIDRHYVMGLPPNFRATVLRQLNAEEPKRKPGIPYEYLNVNRAARHVLQEITYSTPIAETTTKQLDNIKQEMSDQLTTTLFAFQQRMLAEFEKARTTGVVGAPLPANTLSRAHLTSAPNFACLFCGGNDHRIRLCPEAARMIKEGKCIQGSDGRIAMPDGSPIRGGYGTLKDRIEAANKERTRETPPHIASTMMFKSAESVESMFTTSKIEELDEEEDPTANAYKLSTRANKVVEEEEEPPNVRMAGPTKSSFGAQGSKPVLQKETRFADPLVQKAPEPAPKFEHKAAIQPQYKFTSDIEDPELVKKVIDRSLESMVTLSQKELLAVSSDVRKFYKEKTTTRRLPITVGMVEVSGDEESENRTYVLRFVQGDQIRRRILTASPINRLRIVFAILNDSVKAECVLDQGSEIMAMDKKIWEKTQHELKPNKMISMESANSSSSLTAGLCENLKMKFGNLELYLQVHVVENAPFEVLVGRPFFIYTECVTRDYSDGNQDITLTCPNTHAVSTFPTMPRNRIVEEAQPEPDFVQSREL